MAGYGRGIKKDEGEEQGSGQNDDGDDKDGEDWTTLRAAPWRAAALRCAAVAAADANREYASEMDKEKRKESKGEGSE